MQVVLAKQSRFLTCVQTCVCSLSSTSAACLLQHTLHASHARVHASTSQVIANTTVARPMWLRSVTGAWNRIVSSAGTGPPWPWCQDSSKGARWTGADGG